MVVLQLGRVPKEKIMTKSGGTNSGSGSAGKKGGGSKAPCAPNLPSATGKKSGPDHCNALLSARDIFPTSPISSTTYAMRLLNFLTLVTVMTCSASAFALTQSLADIKKEGTRDGARYAQDLRKDGIKVDGTACVVAMAAEDKSRPQFSQVEIETYAKAFGNACLGREVF
jgi:hypothetical protein